MGQARVDRLRDEYDVEVDWRAFELHPEVPPEGMPIPYDPARLAAARANFVRLAEEAGLEHGQRTHWYNSDLAHEATLWARESGGEDALRRAIFRAYFVENRNIGSPDVLCELAAGVGLDAADLRAALDERRYQAAVRADYDEARAVGVTGVPTFAAGGYAIVGAQPYAVFRRLMEVLGQTSRQ